MIKIYLDRNVHAKMVKNQVLSIIDPVLVIFMQWPLEGKTKRIQDYGLPAGDMGWKDLNHTAWNDLNHAWKDFQPTEKYEQIQQIIGRSNREDCIHFDIAVKNACQFYLTSDKHFLHKKETLETLTGIQVFDPMDAIDLESFLKTLKDINFSNQ